MQIMHMDADPAEINKNINVHYPLTGNVDEILTGILKYTKEVSKSEWAETVKQWIKEFELVFPDDGQLFPSYIIDKFCQKAPDAYITTEVGQNQLWAAQHFNFSFLDSLLLLRLGNHGLWNRAAIGVQMAKPTVKLLVCR